MATSAKEEISVIFDGNSNFSDIKSCFQLVKPSFGELNQQCTTLDVVPVLFEEPSLPVQHDSQFQTSHGQDLCSVSMFSEEDKTNSKCTSQVAFVSFVELPVSPKKQMSLDPELKFQNILGLKMGSPDAFSPCIVDIDIAMESFEKPKSINEKTRSTTKGLLTGGLQRQASIKTCGRLMQLLKNQGSAFSKLISRDKLFNERVHDIPNNKLKKYKRSASFNSRKVALLFSILSILGTLILICLTLKVRQTTEGSLNV